MLTKPKGAVESVSVNIEQNDINMVGHPTNKQHALNIMSLPREGGKKQNDIVK